MINFFAIVGLGFLLGMRHATDPDHVVAVTTIVSRKRSLKQAAVIGFFWGAGHTLTIVAVGSAMILFRIVLPPRLGLAMELSVGVMLILLGIRNIGPLFGFFMPPVVNNRCVQETNSQYHTHGDCTHGSLRPMHSHPHEPESTTVRLIDRCFGRVTACQALRPLVVGIVHGLAGSAAIALLVLSTIQSSRWAIAYLLVFGVGTIFGMMLITMTVASTFSLGQKRFAQAGNHFGFATGVISLAFGLFITYQIAFVNGLFTAHATWIPR